MYISAVTDPIYLDQFLFTSIIRARFLYPKFSDHGKGKGQGKARPSSMGFDKIPLILVYFFETVSKDHVIFSCSIGLEKKMLQTLS